MSKTVSFLLKVAVILVAVGAVLTVIIVFRDNLIECGIAAREKLKERVKVCVPDEYADFDDV